MTLGVRIHPANPQDILEQRTNRPVTVELLEIQRAARDLDDVATDEDASLRIDMQ